MIKRIKAYCRELPLRKCLSESNQCETSPHTDPKNPRINRKLGRYQAGQEVKYITQWSYFSYSSVVGGSLFFIEDNSWLLISHE